MPCRQGLHELRTLRGHLPGRSVGQQVYAARGNGVGAAGPVDGRRCLRFPAVAPQRAAIQTGGPERRRPAETAGNLPVRPDGGQQPGDVFHDYPEPRDAGCHSAGRRRLDAIRSGCRHGKQAVFQGGPAHVQRKEGGHYYAQRAVSRLLVGPPPEHYGRLQQRADPGLRGTIRPDAGPWHDDCGLRAGLRHCRV